MRRGWGISILAGLLVLWLGVWPRHAKTPSTQNTLMTTMLGGGEDAGFERALEPRPMYFPEDHGPHPRFKQEWWYMTGNLSSADDGRRFGFELTLFRLALTPEARERTSHWGSSQVQMGHFAITDIKGGQFHHFQRFSRMAMDLAGAVAQPFRVWLGNWSITGDGGSPLRPSLHLAAGTDQIALDLKMISLKPVVLQGDAGLSRKSEEPGNASYYYSLPRLETSGSLTLHGQQFSVSGLSWFDREWSTSALGKHQEGWDWFALQLSDGWDLMFYSMREKKGGSSSSSAGTLIDPQGKTVAISNQGMVLEPLGHWLSPKTGINYPSGWRLKNVEAGLDLEVMPWLKDQELDRTVVRYWEGAVRVRGTHDKREVHGNGYVELAGYRKVP
ncbi:MAG: ABC transporter [Magnetococcales bacterium]|nr:ABC transporter [Magnetococcales bacterium]HIJ82757.1 carotenoid 1,2-hydratase [Magnetococcales bacterium]